MTHRDDAICEADLGFVDFDPPAVQCSRCPTWFTYASDTGLCETCEADEDVATSLSLEEGPHDDPRVRMPVVSQANDGDQ